MFNTSHNRRPAIALVAMLALSTSLAPAYAQTPAPASSPAPAAAPAPGTFNSPFNGNRQSNGEEGKDFTTLMAAYDTMADAAAALQGAINCGGNVTAAMAALNTATAAFNTAAAQYAFDWSSYAYAGIGVPLGGQTNNKFSQKSVEGTGRYNKTDKPAIMSALAAQDTKAHPVPACTPNGTVPVTPSPAPSSSHDGIKSALGGFFVGLATGVLASHLGHEDHDDFGRGQDRVSRITPTDKY